MRQFLLSLFCMCSVALVGCGGGGGSGGLPSMGTPAPAFTVTGTWTAMSWGGIYNIALDESAGTLKYTWVDEVTGKGTSLSVGGMKRGADGAYIFNTLFSVGGNPLNIALYRVDDNTLAGLLLSSMNSSMKLSPVVATRAPVTDAAAMNGNWSFGWFECDYSTADKDCKSSPFYKYDGYRAFGSMNNLVATACYGVATPSAPCAPQDALVTSYNALGGGLYTDGFEHLQAFTVGGQTLLYGHYREPAVADPVFVSAYYARIADLAPTALSGTWRVVSHDGRLGTATITGDTFKVTLAGSSEVTGVFKRNAPWSGLAQLDLPGQDKPYFAVGNEKLLSFSGNFGQFMLHRE